MPESAMTNVAESDVNENNITRSNVTETKFTADNNLAIIPARGGSKRVPGKNIKRLYDKPLIAWTIQAALNSHNIKNLYVSTDSREIADIALAYGAQVPALRSADAATDEAPTSAALKDAITCYEAHTGKHVEWVTLLQATSPFRSTTTIDKGIALFQQNTGDTVVSICEHTTPLAWLTKVNEKGYLQDANIHNTQEKLFQYNGALYVFSRKTLTDTSDIYSDNIHPLVMNDPIESIDIDTPEDWRLAAAIAAGIKS